jgi:hypothetical protein
MKKPKSVKCNIDNCDYFIDRLNDLICLHIQNYVSEILTEDLFNIVEVKYIIFYGIYQN